MDLLAGYGSDASDSDSEQQEQPAPPSRATSQAPSSAPKPSFSSFLPPPYQSAPPTRTASPQVLNTASKPASSSLPADFFDSKATPLTTGSSTLPADFFKRPSAASDDPLAPELGPVNAELPPPSFDNIPSTSASSAGGLWSNLPKPKARRVVTLNVGPKLPPLPRRAAPAPDADDDSPRPVKKSKPSSKSALIDFLPAPKYSSSSFTAVDPNLPTSRTQDAERAPGPAPPPTDPAYDVMYSNEAYRADAPAADYSYPSYDPSSYDPAAYPSTSADPSSAYPAATYAPSSAYPTHPAAAAASGSTDLPAPGPNATAEEIDIFEAALKAERERVARTAGARAAEEVKFVELNQEQLKYVSPAAQSTHDALKEALGSEYALQIRQEAKKHMGSKLARRRHQIGTLYHTAQVMELEMMEKRAQSMKSKKETAAKYGW